MRRVLLYISLPLLLVNSLIAQDHRMMVAQDFRDPASDAIVVKWVADQILFNGGFNVYRRSSRADDWQKLNTTTIMSSNEVSPSSLDNESAQVGQMYQMINDLPYNDLQESGIVRGFITLNLLRTQGLAEALGSVWYDESAERGASYFYKVEGLHDNEIIPIGLSGMITAGQPYEPLSAPEGIEVALQDEVVKLRWDADEAKSVSMYVEVATNGGSYTAMDELGVYVMKSTSESGEEVYPETFVEVPIAEESTVSLRFSAVDLFGQKGELSDVYTVERKDETAPPAPEQLQLVLDAPNQRGTLNWQYTAPPDDFKGFVVLQRSSLDESPRLLRPDTLLNFTMPVQVTFPGTGNYILTVAAVDNAGNIAESEPIGAEINDFMPPAVPTDLRVTEQDMVISLSWSESTARDILGYYVYRYLGEKTTPERSDYVVLNNDPLRTTTFSDTLSKVLQGNIYYTVASLDSAYNRSEIAPAVAYMLPDDTPPSVPVLRSVDASVEGVSLRWYPNVDSDLAAFDLYRIDQNDTLMMIGSALPSDTIFFDRVDQDGSLRTYTLIARDQSGNVSPKSNVLTIQRSTGAKTVSSSIKPNNIVVKYMKAKREATVWWEQQFTEDNLGVVVYRGLSEDGLRPVSGLLKEPQFRDSKVTSGTTYYYQLRTYASNGAKDYSPIQELKIKAEKQ